MSRPFNLAEAKGGSPVTTRSGTPVRIVCFDAVGPEPLVVLHLNDDEDSDSFRQEECWQHQANGRFRTGKESGLDLVMA